MRPIRSRISIMTAVAILITVVAVGIVSLNIMSRLTNDFANELLKLSCEKSSQEVDRYLDSMEQCVNTVSYYAEEEMTGISDEKLQEYLQNVNLLFHSGVESTEGVITYYYRIAPELSSTVEGFWYQKTEDGSFKAGQITDLEDYDSSDVEHVGWYYIPKEKGQAVWLEPYRNENMGGVRMISYVSPVYWHGRFIGVIGIDYDYETLCKHLNYKGSFETGRLFLVNEDDKIIYHPDIESGTDISDVSENLAGKNLSSAAPVSSYFFRNRWQRSSWCELTNHLRLYFAVEENEINRSWYSLAAYFVLVASAILVVFSLLSIYTANRITKPLTDLTEAAMRLDAGDYDVELGYEGDDEIGVLAGAFRQLTGHLKVYISDLNDMAYKDALTSVRNKGAFDMYIGKIEDRIRSGEDGRNTEFAICMFDCNGLKEINDRFGHDKGDIYLKRACALICEVFRHSAVFRLGGDEFACVLQNEDFADRKRLCREFDKACDSINAAEEKPWERVDMAGGIAVYRAAEGDDAQTVLKRADERMYEDKRRKKAGEKGLRFGRYAEEDEI